MTCFQPAFFYAILPNLNTNEFMEIWLLLWIIVLYLNMDMKIQIFPEALDLILEQKQ